MHKVPSRYDGLMEHYQTPPPKSPLRNIILGSIVVGIFLWVWLHPHKAHSQSIDTAIGVVVPIANKYKDTSGSVNFTYKGIPKQADSVYLSKWPGDLSSFIKYSQDQKKVAVIDKNISVDRKAIVYGQFADTTKIIGINGANISALCDTLFSWRGGGVFYVDGLNIYSGFTGPDTLRKYYNVAFATTWKPLWTGDMIFRNINIFSGFNGLYSSHGVNVKYDFINCSIHSSQVCIAIFSLDGNTKDYWADNCSLNSDTSSSQYIHPDVSLHIGKRHLGWGINIVHCQQGSKVGTVGYAIHFFSGARLPGSGTTANAKAIEICNVSGPYLWELGVGQVPAVIDSSDIAFPGRTWVNATACRFSNLGGGVPIKGTVTKCTGEIWTTGVTGDTLTAADCDLAYMNLKLGGVAILRNTRLKTGWSEKLPFDVTFANTTMNQFGMIGQLAPLGSRLTFINSPLPAWQYNRIPQSGVVVVVPGK